MELGREGLHIISLIDCEFRENSTGKVTFYLRRKLLLVTLPTLFKGFEKCAVEISAEICRKVVSLWKSAR